MQRTNCRNNRLMHFIEIDPAAAILVSSFTPIQTKDREREREKEFIIIIIIIPK